MDNNKQGNQQGMDNNKQGNQQTNMVRDKQGNNQQTITNNGNQQGMDNNKPMVINKEWTITNRVINKEWTQ